MVCVCEEGEDAADAAAAAGGADSALVHLQCR